MADHSVINSSNTPILWILIPFALIMLALLIGIGITHYFLSKSKNKKLGWFVPTVFFVLGLVKPAFLWYNDGDRNYVVLLLELGMKTMKPYFLRRNIVV